MWSYVESCKYDYLFPISSQDAGNPMQVFWVIATGVLLYQVVRWNRSDMTWLDGIKLHSNPLDCGPSMACLVLNYLVFDKHHCSMCAISVSSTGLKLQRAALVHMHTRRRALMFQNTIQTEVWYLHSVSIYLDFPFRLQVYNHRKADLEKSFSEE